MTQQYLVGELSSLLGELQAVAAGAPGAYEIARLRRVAEATPPATLGPQVACALLLANRACGEALATGSATAFLRDLAICAELRAWGVCAGYVAELPAGSVQRRTSR